LASRAVADLGIDANHQDGSISAGSAADIVATLLLPRDCDTLSGGALTTIQIDDSDPGVTVAGDPMRR
jgi:hypothetical protein